MEAFHASHRAVRGIAGDTNPIWAFHYADVELAVDSWAEKAADGSRVPARRDVYIYMTPPPYALVRIELRDTRAGATIPPEPSAISSETQRHNAGPELWTPPPIEKRVPEVSLAKALDAISARGLGSAKDGALVIAQYVVMTRGLAHLGKQPEPVPVWSIDVRGTTPIPPIGAGQPDKAKKIDPNALNHLRHLVGAVDGKWRWATSVPQPDPEPPVPAGPASDGSKEEKR